MSVAHQSRRSAKPRTSPPHSISHATSPRSSSHSTARFGGQRGSRPPPTRATMFVRQSIAASPMPPRAGPRAGDSRRDTSRSGSDRSTRKPWLVPTHTHDESCTGQHAAGTAPPGPPGSASRIKYRPRRRQCPARDPSRGRPESWDRRCASERQPGDILLETIRICAQEFASYLIII